ncbi:MAG: hypothetical protein ACFFG0_34615 [Candidatus Thorarchaeota archaeon]
MFTKQTMYCNCCGTKMFVVPSKAVGREYRCCSLECANEMDWRWTLSILGKEYYPRPEEENEK